MTIRERPHFVAGDRDLTTSIAEALTMDELLPEETLCCGARMDRSNWGLLGGFYKHPWRRGFLRPNYWACAGDGTKGAGKGCKRPATYHLRPSDGDCGTFCVEHARVLVVDGWQPLPDSAGPRLSAPMPIQHQHRDAS